MITETKLVDDKQLREQYINRLEVLDKVKSLFLIPKMKCMTIHQVADYYEVPVETIKSQYKTNRDEFDSDGCMMKTPSDFKILNGWISTVKKMEQLNGKFIVAIDDNVTLVIPNRGIKVFPKRAILRMGMLLRDSPIAKEIRTQLLNITENTYNENLELLTKEIETEENLLLNIGKAFASGDIMEFAKATQKHADYQNRHIIQLQKENEKISAEKKLLATNVLKWTDRASANKIIRTLAYYLKISVAESFNTVYNELLYKYHINLKQRGGKPYIQNLKDDEWIYLYKVVAAICETNNIDISKLFSKAKINIKELCL